MFLAESGEDDEFSLDVLLESPGRSWSYSFQQRVDTFV